MFAEMMATPDDPGAFDAMAPENIAPLVVWLGSSESRDVTGRVFELEGGKVSVTDGWQHGPAVDKGDRWDPAELGPVVRELPATADDTTRAIALLACSRARVSAIPITAAAPSFSGQAWPAVTSPAGRNTGFSSGSFSTVVPSRGPSSFDTTVPSGSVTGVISR